MKHYFLGFLSFFVGIFCFAQAPIVTSFSPVSQVPGGLDTIFGSNFNLTASNNLVQFGTAKATVLSALSNQLIVQVPFGARHNYITVINTANSLNAASPRKFIPIFNNQPNAYFEPSKRIKRRSQQQIAIGDLNLDGKQDLVVVDSLGRGINIFQNINSPGLLNPDSFVFIGTISTSMGASAWCNSIRLADLNGDGKPEILMNDVQTIASNLRVIRNNCIVGATILPAYFSSLSIYNSSTYTVQNFDVNDLNQDGKPEIALITRQGLLILKNNITAGTITAASFSVTATITSTTPTSEDRDVRIGDIDRDGKNDIVFTTSSTKEVYVIKNNAIANSGLLAADFASFIALSNGVNKPYSLELADLDQDGRLDIITGGENYVKVFRNASYPGFLSGTSFNTRLDLNYLGDFTRVISEDMNGDGKPDLILTNGFLKGFIHILENRFVSGNFSNCMFVKTHSIRSTPTDGLSIMAGMDIGDLNQDGLPDMVTVFRNDSSMWFFKGSTVFKPLIESVTPNFGIPGDTISINGINFSSNVASTFVQFGNVNAQVIAASASQVKVILPNISNSGFVQLTANGKTAYSPRIYTPTIKSETGFCFEKNTDIPCIAKNPMYVISIDLNNDKKPELIVINQDSNSIGIYRNMSTKGVLNASSFAAPFYLRTPYKPDQIIVTDLDMDGKNELLINYTNSATFSVFKNNFSSGVLEVNSFGLIQNFDRSLNITSKMIVSDMDHDGKPDILNLNNLFFSCVLNSHATGALDSNSFLNYSFSNNAPANLFTNFELGDLDGDGRPEVVATYNTGSVFTIYKNALTPMPDAASAGLSNYFDIPYSRPGKVLVADMDLDGKNDLVVFSYNGDTLSIFKNTSSNGCLNAASFQRNDIRVKASGSSFRKSIIDINGDHKPDILTEINGSLNGGELFAYINTSTSNVFSFSPLSLVNTAPASNSSCIEDLDGDSIPDLVTSNYYSGSINSISLYKGISISNFPQIDYFTPKKSLIGRNDTIYGNYFSPIATDNVVKFGPVKANVLNAGKTRLVVRIPEGASFDKISVSVNGSTAMSSTKFHPIFSDTGANFSTTLFSSVAITESLFSGSMFDINFEDIDLNGMPDLIAVGSGVEVFKNLLQPKDSIIGASFGPANNLIFGNNKQLELSDLNGDGKRDITVISSSNQLNTLTNVSTIGVVNSSSFSNSSRTLGGACTKYMGDFNQDNKPDLFVKLSTNTLDTYKNNTAITGGTISYETTDCNNFSACSGSSYLAGALTQADLDGDLVPEIIVGCLDGSNNLSIKKFSKTNPGFVPTNTTWSLTLTTDTTPEFILTADLDNDAKIDLLTVSRAGKKFSVHKNIFNGVFFDFNSFDPKLSFVASATLTPTCAELGDIDGDGRVDLAIGFNNGSFSLFRNVSQTGVLNATSFAAGVNFTTALSSLGSLKIQDINADGKPEIVVAGTAANGFVKVYVYISQISVLPVKLLDFTANVCGKDCAILHWQTASETNNSHFEIERSLDQQKWKTIGQIKGHGNSTNLQNYQYTDLLEAAILQNASTIYYRLKQVDFDGAFEYSPIRQVQFEEDPFVLKLFPNPFEESLTISYKNTETLQVSVYNSLGTKVYANHHYQNDQMNLKFLPAGMYLIQVKDKKGDLLYAQKHLKR